MMAGDITSWTDAVITIAALIAACVMVWLNTRD